MKPTSFNQGIQMVLNSCFFSEPNPKVCWVLICSNILGLSSFVPCPRNRTDIWFPVCAGTLQGHTVWEAFTDLIMIEVMHLLHTRHRAKRVRTASQSQGLMQSQGQNQLQDREEIVLGSKLCEPGTAASSIPSPASWDVTAQKKGGCC